MATLFTSGAMYGFFCFCSFCSFFSILFLLFHFVLFLFDGLVSSVSGRYSEIDTVMRRSASTCGNRLPANLFMTTQYCCADIFSCTPAVTDSPAGTGMNNAFLLIFVLFLNETILPDCLSVEEVRPDTERDEDDRENCQQREQRIAHLPATIRRLAQPIFSVVAERMVAGAALSVVVCHIYGLNIVFFRS